jgi:hypothetical protein
MRIYCSSSVARLQSQHSLRSFQLKNELLTTGTSCTTATSSFQDVPSTTLVGFQTQ